MNFDSKTLNSLAVSLHGRHIGVINRLGGDRHLFSFEQDYLDDANRPTLSLSFKGQAGGLVIPTRAVATRLPVFFSNLLPEGHLREYLAARAGVKQQREFFLLAVLGADLPGALTIAPMEQDQRDGTCSSVGLSFVQSTRIHSSAAVRETTSWRKAISNGRKPPPVCNGVAKGVATEILSLDMKFSEVSLTTGRSGSAPVLLTNSAYTRRSLAWSRCRTEILH
jgi:HipA-like protein